MSSLDIYSLMITAKYFVDTSDFINIIQVNSKFMELLDMYHFNPISVCNLILFPNIQTQYLYSKSDIKIIGLKHYVISYLVDYNTFLLNDSETKYQQFEFTKFDRQLYGNELPSYEQFKQLGMKCFDNCSIQKIELCNSISNINNNCFSNCKRLTRIVLSTSLKTLSNECFKECCNLLKINLPNTLTSIGKYCFKNCIKLSKLHLSQSLKMIGMGSFYHCNSIVSCQLPNSLQSLSNELFFGCISLTSITLPKYLISIGKSCFAKCASLNEIQFPTTLTSFGNCSFYGCNLLNSNTTLKSSCFKKPLM
ncbi:Leucine rich repeat containing protein BspA family protein [Entamoeba marina]